MSLRKCFICGSTYNGIILKKNKICLRCEKDIVSCNDFESSRYKFYIEQMKKILFK